MSRSFVDQGQACLSPLVGVKVKVEDHLLIKAKLVSIGWSQGQGRRFYVDQGFVQVDQYTRLVLYHEESCDLMVW